MAAAAGGGLCACLGAARAGAGHGITWQKVAAVPENSERVKVTAVMEGKREGGGWMRRGGGKRTGSPPRYPSSPWHCCSPPSSAACVSPPVAERGGGGIGGGITAAPVSPRLALRSPRQAEGSSGEHHPAGWGIWRSRTYPQGRGVGEREASPASLLLWEEGEGMRGEDGCCAALAQSSAGQGA